MATNYKVKKLDEIIAYTLKLGDDHLNYETAAH